MRIRPSTRGHIWTVPRWCLLKGYFIRGSDEKANYLTGEDVQDFSRPGNCLRELGYQFGGAQASALGRVGRERVPWRKAELRGRRACRWHGSSTDPG